MLDPWIAMPLVLSHTLKRHSGFGILQWWGGNLASNGNPLPMRALLPFVFVRTANPAISAQDVADMFALVWTLLFIMFTASGIVVLLANRISSLVSICRLQDGFPTWAAQIFAPPFTGLISTWRGLGGTVIVTSTFPTTTAASTASRLAVRRG